MICAIVHIIYVNTDNRLYANIIITLLKFDLRQNGISYVNPLKTSPEYTRAGVYGTCM